MAAKLDMFADIQVAVADDDYCDIRPAAGHEAVVHNIYFAAAIEVYRWDGSNEVKIVPERSGPDVLSWLDFHVGYTDRIRVKNVSGETQNIAYDGIYTKVA